MHFENSIITDKKIAWNQWFWYDWIAKNNFKLEAYAMNKSITQENQNDKRIWESIKGFFLRFQVSSDLKASNAYKQKGITIIEIF